jgi:Homeodomain-like domain
LFKVAFGSDAKAARALGVSRMTVWRWRHDRSVLPIRVAEWLVDRVQFRVTEAHEAQNQLRDFLALPPRPPRPLSGCCAGLHRRAKRMPVTPEEWAALG